MLIAKKASAEIGGEKAAVGVQHILHNYGRRNVSKTISYILSLMNKHYTNVAIIASRELVAKNDASYEDAARQSLE